MTSPRRVRVLVLVKIRKLAITNHVGSSTEDFVGISVCKSNSRVKETELNQRSKMIQSERTTYLQNQKPSIRFQTRNEREYGSELREWVRGPYQSREEGRKKRGQRLTSFFLQSTCDVFSSMTVIPPTQVRRQQKDISIASAKESA